MSKLMPRAQKLPSQQQRSRLGSRRSPMDEPKQQRADARNGGRRGKQNARAAASSTPSRQVLPVHELVMLAMVKLRLWIPVEDEDAARSEARAWSRSLRVAFDMLQVRALSCHRCLHRNTPHSSTASVGLMIVHTCATAEITVPRRHTHHPQLFAACSLDSAHLPQRGSASSLAAKRTTSSKQRGASLASWRRLMTPCSCWSYRRIAPRC